MVPYFKYETTHLLQTSAEAVRDISTSASQDRPWHDDGSQRKDQQRHPGLSGTATMSQDSGRIHF